ncbi:MAG TPA: DNRLRE domain-containing protein [Anaerolineae bacterium]|nr:DNRLRE domain-containing protein [Anaerolineae bacterium]
MKAHRLRTVVLWASLLCTALLLAAGDLPVLGSAAGAPESSPANTLTIQTTRDTYVSQRSFKANYGSASDLFVGRASDKDLQTLVWFDLSTLPSGAQVTAATVRLAAEANLSTRAEETEQNLSIWADALTGDWDETAVRWLDKPDSADL